LRDEKVKVLKSDPANHQNSVHAQPSRAVRNGVGEWRNVPDNLED